MLKNTNLGASLARAWTWSAVLKGAFAALSLLVLLRYLGAAFGISLGDGVLGGVFALWSILAQTLALAVGGALTAYLAGASRPLDGALAGLSTWIVTTVASAALLGGIAPQTATSAVWSIFLGLALSTGSAVVGGILVAASGSRRSRPAEPSAHAPPRPPAT